MKQNELVSEVLDDLRQLYAVIGNEEKGNGSWKPNDFIASGCNKDCPVCLGFGTFTDIDPSLLIDPKLSIKRGAVLLWAGTTCRDVTKIKELAKMIGIEYDKPLVDQDKRFTDILLYGYFKEPVNFVHKKKPLQGYYMGSVWDIRYLRDSGTTSRGNITKIERFTGKVRCSECNGKEHEQEVLSIKIEGLNIVEVSRLPISAILKLVRKMNSSKINSDIETRLIQLSDSRREHLYN